MSTGAALTISNDMNNIQNADNTCNLLQIVPLDIRIEKLYSLIISFMTEITNKTRPGLAQKADLLRVEINRCCMALEDFRSNEVQKNSFLDTKSLNLSSINFANNTTEDLNSLENSSNFGVEFENKIKLEHKDIATLGNKRIECNLEDLYKLNSSLLDIIERIENGSCDNTEIMIGHTRIDLNISSKFLITKQTIAANFENLSTNDIIKKNSYIKQLENEIEELKCNSISDEYLAYANVLQENMAISQKIVIED